MYFNVLGARVVKGYMRDPGQQGFGHDIPTLLPTPYRLDTIDTLIISPVFLPFDIAKDRKITDKIYQNPDSCVLLIFTWNCIFFIVSCTSCSLFSR